MNIKQMASVKLSPAGYRPLNRWNYDHIQPGEQHSVGDTQGYIRLKHSFPNAPLRYDKTFTGKSKLVGNANGDGGHANEFTHAKVPVNKEDSAFQEERHFQTAYGFYRQDLRAPDTLHAPFMGPLPQYSWHNKIATTYAALTTGEKFLPVPGPYQQSPGEVDRGGQVPVTTSIDGGEFIDPSMPFGPPESVRVGGMIGGSYGTPDLRANAAKTYKMFNKRFR